MKFKLRTDCCKIGIYKCSVSIEIPNHMKDYKYNRIKAGLSSKINIDECILKEIKYLWKNGIKTYGSCCGHGIKHSWVNVDESDFVNIENLGYEKLYNNENNFTYKLKFVY